MITKTDLINLMAAEPDATKSQAARRIDGVIGHITAQLAAGHEVRLHGFGTFSVTEREATIRRNPRTGEKIEIAAKRVVKFRASKALSETLNG